MHVCPKRCGDSSLKFVFERQCWWQRMATNGFLARYKRDILKTWSGCMLKMKWGHHMVWFWRCWVTSQGQLQKSFEIALLMYVFKLKCGSGAPECKKDDARKTGGSYGSADVGHKGNLLTGALRISISNFTFERLKHEENCSKKAHSTCDYSKREKTKPYIIINSVSGLVHTWQGWGFLKPTWLLHEWIAAKEWGTFTVPDGADTVLLTHHCPNRLKDNFLSNYIKSGVTLRSF